MSDETDNMLKSVESYLTKVDSLFNKTYGDGKKEKEELYNKVSYFILSSFPDGKERFNKFWGSFPTPLHSLGYNETEEEEQIFYISYLKAIQKNLVALQEELQAKEPKKNIKTKPVHIKESNIQEETTASRVISGEDLVALQEELQAKKSKENAAGKRNEIEKLNQEISKLKDDIQNIKEILVSFGDLLHQK